MRPQKIYDDAQLLSVLSGQKRKPGPLSPKEKEIISFIEKKTKLDLSDLIKLCPECPKILYRFEDTLRTKPKKGAKISFENRSFTGAANGGGAAMFFHKEIPEIGKGLCYAILKNTTKAANISEYQKHTKNSMFAEEEYIVSGNFKVVNILDKPATLYLVLEPIN